MENRPDFATYKGIRIFKTYMDARRAARKAQGPVVGYMVDHPQGDAWPTPCRIVATCTRVHSSLGEMYDPHQFKAAA